MWSGLQDEAELLNILGNVRLNLQPFLASQESVFSEAYLHSLLETAKVKTDEQRMSESSGMADVTQKYTTKLQFFNKSCKTAGRDRLFEIM